MATTFFAVSRFIFPALNGFKVLLEFLKSAAIDFVECPFSVLAAFDKSTIKQNFHVMG